MAKKSYWNIIYPSTAHKIDGYMDSRIIPTSVRYIISTYKGKKKIIQGGDILRLLRKKNPEEKCLNNYVNK